MGNHHYYRIACLDGTDFKLSVFYAIRRITAYKGNYLGHLKRKKHEI